MIKQARLVALGIALVCFAREAVAERLPNILFILADDLGYGDVACYNPESKVPTPNLDRLASEGIRFTDAHSPSTVCTPTRYSILTGRMEFRTGMRGVFSGVGGPCLIEEGRLTLPEMLRRKGYVTALFGKWHVGMTFFDREGSPINKSGREPVTRVDFTRRIPDAPIHRGFDRFFGTVSCPTTDWLYAYVDGDRVPVPPIGVLDKTNLPKHAYSRDNRPGFIAPDFDLEEVDMVFLRKSVEFLEQHAKATPEKPFFLFHSCQAVHLPSFPADRFKGKTRAGPHGDFIFELDHVVGDLLKTLERLGVAENTLVMVSSDNGPEVTSVVHMRTDHGHDGARPWRGMKRDQWEGGHRVPFIARWPGKIAAGSTSDETLCLTDLMATCASIVGAKLPNDAAEDSFDVLPALLGKKTDRPARRDTLHQTISLALAIRSGPWKYLDHKGSGGNRYDRGRLKAYALEDTAPEAPGQLYNLETDAGEAKNVYFEHPDIVESLKSRLVTYRRSGRSAPAREGGKNGENAGARTLIAFERHELTDVYYSEGASAGDIDRDGNVDAVCGPYWFAGPGFETRHEIYPAKPQPTERYSDNFFSWVLDFNGDGWNDVFTVGFPGTPAHVYENPGKKGLGAIWKKHEVFDWVSNESPHFTNLVGDARPELVCTRDGSFGYATVDWSRPFEAWTFHAVSGSIAHKKFGHGLGVGDVNGDGRADLLYAGGWFEQPHDLATAWTRHEVAFSDSYGGAEMHVYDVDGDGDNDVITSLAAHDFGLAWYEQTTDGADGGVSFTQHRIMGDRPEHNRYGLVFSELHSVNLADIDGDGLKDIVTGKTYWSHHKKSPMWNAGAVVYWFRLVRGEDGVDWVPYRADGESGIGRQVGVFDVNGDELPDIVVGGMKGANVLIQKRERVGEERWRAAQPKVFAGPGKRADRGPLPSFDATGHVPGAIEGESLKVVRAGGGKTRVQKMGGFKKSRWSGDAQLFWTGATPRARLELEVELPESGTFDVSAVLTTARDYGIVNLLLDSEALCKPIDLYEYPDVRTTGVLAFGSRKLEAGTHRLTVELIGANDSAAKAYMVGLDYVRFARR